MGEIRKVAVIGTGTLGTQIALQASSHGYDVAIYNADERAFERTLETIKRRIENTRREKVPLALRLFKERPVGCAGI